MLRNARSRATRSGVPCTITLADIVIPSHCPVLGIRLICRQGRKGGHDASPSLDRIRPALGYVPGNVIVVSNRVNRIKTDATPAELTAVADFYTNAIRTVRPRRGRASRTRKDPA